MPETIAIDSSAGLYEQFARAVSVPLEQLEERLEELPAEAETVAYCRGPDCLLSSRARELLRAHGRRAGRLEDGFPEWRLAGRPVAIGAEGR
ncbi:MAG TPA: rhodanese-like domain-containing protein [Gaiellaceae bacterium]|nr:rhodanese-like domain-containing protein [Gaiellaceae bacterium]